MAAHAGVLHKMRNSYLSFFDKRKEDRRHDFASVTLVEELGRHRDQCSIRAGNNIFFADPWCMHGCTGACTVDKRTAVQGTDHLCRKPMHSCKGPHAS